MRSWLTKLFVIVTVVTLMVGCGKNGSGVGPTLVCLDNTGHPIQCPGQIALQ